MPLGELIGLILLTTRFTLICKVLLIQYSTMCQAERICAAENPETILPDRAAFEVFREHGDISHVLSVEIGHGAECYHNLIIVSHIATCLSSLDSQKYC